MNQFPAAWAVLALTTFAACNNNPAQGVPKAGTSAPVIASALPSPPSGAKSLAFSQANSKIEFVGAKITGKHDGSFSSFSGMVNLVDGAPHKSSVSVDIQMNSLTSDAEMLTTHLKGKDFFDVEKFPKSRFVSTSIASAPNEQPGVYSVTGTLEMHGVSKSITFPATIDVSGASVRVKAEFAINRKDFGVVYPGKPDDLIKDDVLIRLNIAAASN